MSEQGVADLEAPGEVSQPQLISGCGYLISDTVDE
jgi:hypothetical protein